MSVQHTRPSSRRGFLGGLTFAGTAGLLGTLPRSAAAEPPPETTRLRVHHSLSLCLAPQYVAEELLRAEGFTEVNYVTHADSGGLYEGLASGAADIGNDFAPMLIMHVDAVTRSRSWAACTSAASSCSEPSGSAPSGT
jgi:NitT/TauT family transport system substrate-binding protein